MKRLFILVFFVIVASNTSFIKATGSNASASAISTTETKLSQAEIDAMVNRIDQIHNMDFHKMSANERRSLKKEVKEIKRSMAISGNGGLYLSGTAIIIIILILILVL